MSVFVVDTDVNRSAVDTVPCRSLAQDAQAVAIATGQTVYDSMYVALAIRLDTALLTADDRLEAAMAPMPAVARHIRHIRRFDTHG